MKMLNIEEYSCISTGYTFALEKDNFKDVNTL